LAEALNAFCEVLSGEDALERAFDLCLVDARHARRLEARIRARREEEAPAVLPFLLVTERQGPSGFAPQLRRQVDEVIRAPVDREELETRIATLLKMRRLSLDMQQRADDLAARLHR